MIYQITKQFKENKDVIYQPRSSRLTLNSLIFARLESAAAHCGGALMASLGDLPVYGTRLIPACANEPDRFRHATP